MSGCAQHTTCVAIRATSIRERIEVSFMPNLMMTEYQILALREFGAVAIDFVAEFVIGDELTVMQGGQLRLEPYNVAVVDVTDSAVWLRAVRSE